MNKDEKIYTLLSYMETKLESLGRHINQTSFDFSYPCTYCTMTGYFEVKSVKNSSFGDDFLSFQKNQDLDEDGVKEIISICKSNDYIKTTAPYSSTYLTTDGKSFIKKYEELRTQPAQSFTVETVNGPIQIGNGNIQNNIDNTVQYLMQVINESSASVAEKEEAKSRLASFLKHPIIANLVSAAIIAMVKIKAAI